MANKRVTNECIQRELGQISATLKSLRHDIEEIKEIAPRVKSLELFRSYLKGGSAVAVVLVSSVLAAFKGIFNHF